MGNNKRKYILSIAFMMLLFAITYYILFSNYSFEATFDIIGDVKLPFVGLALLAAFGFLFFESLSLKATMDALGSPISFGKSMKYTSTGFYFSAITPSSSGGQPMEIYYMSKEGQSVSASAMSMMLMAVLYKVALLSVGIPLAFIKARLVFVGLPYFRILFGVGIFLISFMAGLLLFVMFSKTLIYKGVTGVVRLLGKLRLIKNPVQREEKLLSMVQGYHDAAAFIKNNPRLSVKVFIFNLCQRLSLFSVGYFIYLSFGMTGLGWVDVVAIQIGLSIAVDQLPFPGAVGVSEGVFLGLYSGIYGERFLVPAMVLVRTCTYYLPMLICGVVTGAFHLSLIGKSPKELINKRRNSL